MNEIADKNTKTSTKLRYQNQRNEETKGTSKRIEARALTIRIVRRVYHLTSLTVGLGTPSCRRPLLSNSIAQ